MISDEQIILTEEELKLLPFGYQQVYREQGKCHLKREKPREALLALHTAAAAYPDDKEIIGNRGRSRLKLGLFNTAQQDAQELIRTNEYDKDGILLEARAQYQMGNIESSLLMYYRGINKRGRRVEFREGRRAVEATLENCIGRNAGSALTDLQSDVMKMAQHEKELEKLKAEAHSKKRCLQEMMNGDNHHHTFEKQNRHKLKLEQRHKRLAKTYLGKMYDDFQWCNTQKKKLAPTSNLDPTIKAAISMAEQHLAHELELLQIRKPLYHLRNKSKPFKDVQERQTYQDQLVQQRILKATLNKSLQNLKTMRESRQFKDLRIEAMNIRKNLLKYKVPKSILALREDRKKKYLMTDENSKSKLQECIKALEAEIQDMNRYKFDILTETCDVLGQAYLEQYHFRPHLTKKENYRRINFIKLAIKNQIDPFVQSTSFPFFNETSWHQNCQDLLNQSELPTERAWLHYEIAKSYISNKKWDHAVAECKNCIENAKEGESIVWQLNGLILISLIESQRREGGEARTVLEDCIPLAHRIQNEHTIEFLEGFKHVLRQGDGESMRGSAEKLAKDRENLILSLMDDTNLRAHVRKLLSGIRSMPRHRRLCIVPGAHM